MLYLAGEPAEVTVRQGLIGEAPSLTAELRGPTDRSAAAPRPKPARSWCALASVRISTGFTGSPWATPAECAIFTVVLVKTKSRRVIATEAGLTAAHGPALTLAEEHVALLSACYAMAPRLTKSADLFPNRVGALPALTMSFCSARTRTTAFKNGFTSATSAQKSTVRCLYHSDATAGRHE